MPNAKNFVDKNERNKLIKKLRHDGIKQTVIAEMFGLTPTWIGKIAPQKEFYEKRNSEIMRLRLEEKLRIQDIAIKLNISSAIVEKVVGKTGRIAKADNESFNRDDKEFTDYSLLWCSDCRKWEVREKFPKFRSGLTGQTKNSRSGGVCDACKSKRTSIWAQENPRKIAIYNNKRRCRILGIGGEITVEQWNKLCFEFDNKCLSCGEKPDVLAMDHIMPLDSGGPNLIENIQPLCKRCNSKKSNQTIDYRPYIPKWIIAIEKDRKKQLTLFDSQIF